MSAEKPTTEAEYAEMVRKQAEVAAEAELNLVMACFVPKLNTDPTLLPELRDALKSKLVHVWTAGHEQAMREVERQQAQVLQAIKNSNDAMDVVIKQRNALKVQLDMLRGRRP